MAGICRNRIASGGTVNYHIFLNSTDDINRILLTTGLTSENTRVICSMNEEAMKRNLAKLPKGFTISKALDEVKPINFYTSTCFEGQDIIDPNGRSFIVSHAGKEHTMLDISTTFIQICGRIRHSVYNDEIVHFYSTNRYIKDVTLEQFEQATYRVMEEAEKSATWLNSSPDHLKPKLISQLPYMNEPYIRVSEGNMIVDRNMANFDIMNYKVVNGIYQSKCNVVREMEQNGLCLSNDDDYTAPQSIKLLSQVKIGFKELFDLYCHIREGVSIFSPLDYRLEIIENRNPLVKEAYDTLGKEEVRRRNYHQSNIRRELTRRSNTGNDYKIASLVEHSLPMQKAVPIADAKRTLQSIYDTLGISKTATATDLNK